MTKIKVTDAAKQLGAGAQELLDRISGTRKGTADTLSALRKLEEKLAAEDTVRIRLHVFDNNTPAIRLYQKAGYAVYDHCDPASTYMEKEIGT